MKKFLSILILLLLMPSVLADGVIIKPSGDFIKEHRQFAVINYEDGLQKMIIATQTDYSDEKSVWIFPVPASPDEVVIDVVPNVPRMYGYDVLDEAERNVERVFENIRKSQIYTFIFDLFIFRGGVTYDLEKGRAETLGAEVEVGQSVEVIEHIEKEGMVTELVTAKDGAALRLYLVNKGFNLPDKLVPVLRDYSNKDYSYVVSWLAEPKGIEHPIYSDIPRIIPYQRRNVGVEIIFPTDELYFPMRPTSVYGSEKIPVDIYILGLYEAKLYNKIESFVTVRYFKSYGNYFPEYEIQEFFGASNLANKEYTLVQVNNAPSKYLEDDFWFKEGAPTKIKFASKIVGVTRNNRTLLSFIFLGIVSLLAAFITSLVFFRDQWKKFTLIGLANILSIIGLIVAVILVKSKKIDSSLRAKLRQQGVLAITSDFGRKLGFIAIFSVLFLILSWFLQSIFLLFF